MLERFGLPCVMILRCK